MRLASRIWVSEDATGATAVYFEPTDGALVFDCVACTDATGGVCAEHLDETYRENEER
jgi:hypothetical protein